MMASSSDARENESEDIPVLRADQDKISNFARLDFKRRDRIEEETLLKEEIQRLKDAVDESTLCMDFNGVLLKVGESFVCGLEEAEISDYIEQRQQKATANLEVLQNEIRSIVEEMSDLKASLYAKFGPRRINLEFE